MRTLFLLFILFLTSCVKENNTKNTAIVDPRYCFEAIVPIYAPISKVKEYVKFQNPKSTVNAGKLLVYRNWIFLVEKKEGVHIIDNTNPSNPQKIGFITIPVAEDIHLKNDVLYSVGSNFILSVDVSNVRMPSVLSITTDIGGYYSDSNKTYKDSFVYAYQNRFVHYNYYSIAYPFEVLNLSDINTVSNTSTAKVGSMARVAIVSDYLYYVSISKMVTFKLVSKIPQFRSSQLFSIPNIETIFPYKNNLFLGAFTGMYIYGTNNPDMPNKIGELNHVRSCDPVVVEGDYAYVTLSRGNFCSLNAVDELKVIDVSNLSTPKLIKDYPMYNPKGLAIENNKLFICDGSEGLKIFDATDKKNIDLNKIATFKDGTMQDLILDRGKIITVTNNAIIQYSYSDFNNIYKLSEIR
jgi:hypothetical protein